MGLADIPRLRREVADPIALGDEIAETVALGHMLTLGDDWPLGLKTLLLRRRSLYPTPSDWAYVGMEQSGATTIRNWPGVDHAASQAYQYAIAVALGNGYISEWSEPVRLEFDSGGSIITDMPNQPYAVNAEPTESGEFVVSWQYDTWGQGGAPASFEVYAGSDSAMTYTEPGIEQETYIEGTLRYSVTTTTIGASEGDLHRFAVRAKSSSGNVEQNEDTTGVVIARADGPVDAAAIRFGYPRRT